MRKGGWALGVSAVWCISEAGLLWAWTRRSWAREEAALLFLFIFSPPSSSSQFPSCKTGPVTSRTPAALWNGKPARRSEQTAAIYSQPDLSCQWELTAISFLNLLGSPAVQLLQTVRLHSALAAFQRSEEDSVSHAFQITRPYIRNPFS